MITLSLCLTVLFFLLTLGNYMARLYCAIICVYAYVFFHYIVIVPLFDLASESLMFFLFVVVYELLNN